MRVLFVSYNGAMDSLGQSQILPYLREIRKDGHEVILVTFERLPHRRVTKEIGEVRDALSRLGIRWLWLRYHKRPPVLSTIWDVTCGVALVLWLTFIYTPAVLHARSQVAAAMAWPVARLLRRRFVFDLRGQMAYEYADGGTWAPDGLLCRLVEQAERRFIRDADGLVVLTRTLAHDVAPLAVRSPMVIPTCVDLDLFTAPAAVPAEAPSRMVYCGSLGARYALDLLVLCYVEAARVIVGLEMLVLTHSDSRQLREAFQEAGVAPSRYRIIHVSHGEIPRYLQQGRFGVLLLRGGRSLRGACPTKVGEYLAAGLPILSSSGIGDCTELLEANRIGVVLKDHSPESFREGLGQLVRLMEEGATLRARCRVVAEKEFSLSAVAGPAYRGLYRSLEVHR
jgi:glycosyltransferase involved in cell wall biosynthesis